MDFSISNSLKTQITKPFIPVTVYDALKSKFGTAVPINTIPYAADDDNDNDIAKKKTSQDGNSIFTFTKSNYYTLNCRQLQLPGGANDDTISTHPSQTNKSFFESQPKG